MNHAIYKQRDPEMLMISASKPEAGTKVVADLECGFDIHYGMHCTVKIERDVPVRSLDGKIDDWYAPSDNYIGFFPNWSGSGWGNIIAWKPRAAISEGKEG